VNGLSHTWIVSVLCHLSFNLCQTDVATRHTAIGDDQRRYAWIEHLKHTMLSPQLAHTIMILFGLSIM